ncbi:MAG: restriction endonuclease subunit S, partial [Bacteroidota bacterium]|nr:restriction endonuclease subunit S [Bacteroidota bacterium]
MENKTTKPFYNSTIPSNWEVKTLGEVATFINGKAYKQEELLSEGKYKVLRVGNFFTKGDWYYSDLEMEENKYVFDGDLMYAWSASFGPRYWNGEKTVFHYHIWKVIPSELITKQFLFSHLIYDAEKILSSTQGGTMFHITKGDMEKRKINLPPIPEQRAIAHVLSLMDTAINQNNQLIVQKELCKKWLMQNLLTGKKRLKGFYGVWKEVALENVFNRVTRKNSEDNTNVVTISAQRGFVRQTDFFNKAIASEIIDNYCLVEKGEFCYNKSYSNGYPWGATKRLNDFDKAVVTTLYICFGIKDQSNTSGDFFEQYFEANLLDRGLTKIAHEGGRAHGLLNVTPSDFFSLKITIPSFEEQTAIAQVLQAADKEIQLLKAKTDKLREQKKGMMQVLLTGKKRLKIN